MWNLISGNLIWFLFMLDTKLYHLHVNSFYCKYFVYWYIIIKSKYNKKKMYLSCNIIINCVVLKMYFNYN